MASKPKIESYRAFVAKLTEVDVLSDAERAAEARSAMEAKADAFHEAYLLADAAYHEARAAWSARTAALFYKPRGSVAIVEAEIRVMAKKDEGTKAHVLALELPCNRLQDFKIKRDILKRLGSHPFAMPKARLQSLAAKIGAEEAAMREARGRKREVRHG